MEVTKVHIIYANSKDYGTCGEARIVIDNILVISRVSIVKGKKGIFVGMQNMGHILTESAKKKLIDIVYTTDKAFKESIEEKVLSAYYAKLNEQTNK